jgi:hypothetical protein
MRQRTARLNDGSEQGSVEREVAPTESVSITHGRTTASFPSGAVESKYRVVMTRQAQVESEAAAVMFDGGSEVVRIDLYDAASGELLGKEQLLKAFEVSQKTELSDPSDLAMLLSTEVDLERATLGDLSFVAAPELVTSGQTSLVSGGGTSLLTASTSIRETSSAVTVVAKSSLPQGIKRYELSLVIAKGGGGTSGETTGDNGTTTGGTTGGGGGEPTAQSLGVTASSTVVGQIAVAVDISSVRHAVQVVRLYRAAGSVSPSGCPADGSVKTWAAPYGSDSVDFTDTGLTPGDRYSYRACAFDGAAAVIAAGDRVAVKAFSNSLAWSAGFQLSSTAPSSTGHSMAVATDQSEHATIVWEENASGTTTIYSRRFSLVTLTWVAEREVLDTFSNSSYCYPQLGVDIDGNVIAIWKRSDTIRSRRFVSANQAWDAPVDIDTDTTGHHLYVHRNGRALVTYLSSRPSEAAVMANYYTPGQGWLSSAIDIMAGSYQFSSLRGTLNSNGDGAIGFTRGNGGADAIYVGEFTAATFASTAAFRISSEGFPFQKMVLSRNDSGRTLVVWQSDGDTNAPDLLYTISDNGNFIAADTIAAANNGSVPSVHLNSDGTALLLYQYYLGKTHALEFNGTTWAATSTPLLDYSVGLHEHRVHFAGDGRAVVALYKTLDGSTPAQVVSSARYYLNGSWSVEHYLGRVFAGSTAIPVIHMNSQNQATAVYMQNAQTDDPLGLYVKILE